MIKRILINIQEKWRDFQSTRTYWKTRYGIKYVVFKLRTTLFHTVRRVEGYQSTTKIIFQIAVSGLGSVFWSIFLFFALTTLEYILRQHFPDIHAAGIDLTNKFLTVFESNSDIKRDGYTAFMGGVASISGIFLGLYFTAVSIGVGQQIDQLSPNLRMLIVNERFGTRYVRLLTILTALSLLLWFNSTALDNQSLLPTLFVLIFTLILIGGVDP